METVQYLIEIDASKEKVWNTMLERETYRQWTKAFDENSDLEGNWEKGSEMRFTALDKEGNVCGMYSRIKENLLYDYISIEHLGMINNGLVDTSSDQVKEWETAYEDYTFTTMDDKTEVKVEMQIPERYVEMMNTMWPRALENLRRLCES